MSTKDLETVTRTATVMRELTDLPFDMQTFEDACERLGKRVADSSLGDDRIGWKYALPDGSELRLGRDNPEGPLMRAFVELYVGGSHDAYTDARQQLLVRQAFNDAYAIALAAAQDTAGPPLLSGIDDYFDEFRLRWALWQALNRIRFPSMPPRAPRRASGRPRW